MFLAEGVRVAVTDRHGGFSQAPYDSRNLAGSVGDDLETVRRNREATAAELGIDPGRVVTMHQVHSADVEYVTRPYGSNPPKLDAVFTDRPNLALLVQVADCVPVLLADPVAGLVGAAHSGRQGTYLGIVPALVQAMAERGADPEAMVALIGPAACGKCYEVSSQLRDEVAAALPETYAETRQGTPALDVRAGVQAQLQAEGLLNIQHDARCTIENPDLYSYRRERRTGRFAGIIWLTTD